MAMMNLQLESRLTEMAFRMQSAASGIGRPLAGDA